MPRIDNVRKQSGLNRRAFLIGAAGTLPVLYGGLERLAAAADRPSPGRLGNDGGPAGSILRQRHPDNLEYSFSSLDRFLTPNEHFYVRTHFGIPSIDLKEWRLRIEGTVKRPVAVSYEELRSMPSVTLTSLLECSGNGRVFLKPPQPSIRWELGGVSNAEWTGVRLSDVLARANVQDDAMEVILEGADQGSVESPHPRTPGPISYARSLPMAKANRPEVILAYGMNGKDLPPEHGFPVRAVVAGWYGMASVKWLTRVMVTDRSFDGYFQTFMYSIWERRFGIPTLVPVSEIAVKAEIARPTLHEIVPANTRYRVIGAAWAGESEVTRVDFSSDGGRSWHAARLVDDAVPFAWRFWEYTWHTPSGRSRKTLMARATDSRGRTQPIDRDEDRRDAMISHVLPIEVDVH